MSENTNYSHKDAANRVYNFYAAQHTNLGNWGRVLFTNDFDNEPELRNRIASIYFSALYDTLEANIRINDTLLKSCKQTEKVKLIYYCEKIKEMCDRIMNLLSKYSIEEQLFIYNFRCQIVHAWQFNPFQKEVSVKYVKDNTLITKKIPFDTYHSLIRVYFNEGDIDDTLFRLLSPIWINKGPFIVGILSLCMVPGNMEIIHKEIFEGVV